MIQDGIVVNGGQTTGLDKLQIALAVRDSTYDQELSCSLLEKQVIKNCDSCSLRCICQGIEAVAQDFEKRTTKVINSFSF